MESAINDDSLDAFTKSVLEAVALSLSSEGSTDKCNNDDNTKDNTMGSDGSTTRCSDGSTTRSESSDGNGVRFEHPTISLDESKVPDYGDNFEGVFYRTDVGDSRTVFHFVSKVFYLQFRNKIMSDFSLLMHDDVIKCTTHFRGLKCDLRIDNKTSSVTVSGIGHNIWREDFFPVVARLLFAQYVKYADSQIYASFNDNCGAERKEASNRESATVAIGTEQTAESTPQPPAKGPLTTSKHSYGPPVYTSTPIVYRAEAHQDIRSIPSGLEIMQKIEHMESEISNIKLSVISSVEQQIQDLKSSVIDMCAKLKPTISYSAAAQKPNTNSDVENIRRPNSVNDVRRREVINTTENVSGNQSTDEGFVNNSSSLLGSSQTFVKTTFSLVRNDETTAAIGQPVPVIITNRNQDPESERQERYCDTETRARKSSTFLRTHTDANKKGKILLIGDSILNGINTKGLVKGIQKHAKGGATVQDIIEEISVYDMKNFESCVIYVGGNDCAKGKDVDRFIDEYEQLVSIIKAYNPTCKIYLCEIAPRGDVDVSSFNKSIQGLSKQWERQNVYCLSNTSGYFFDKYHIPAGRYFNKDGIHLSSSGVKRFVDAISTSVKIVVDFDQCVFFNTKKQHQNMNAHAGHRRNNQGHQQKPFQSYKSGNGNGRVSRYRNSRKQCYGCHMVGHIVAECWNIK